MILNYMLVTCTIVEAVRKYTYLLSRSLKIFSKIKEKVDGKEKYT